MSVICAQFGWLLCFRNFGILRKQFLPGPEAMSTCARKQLADEALLCYGV